jgi:AcrR family transcriptional regulator
VPKVSAEHEQRRRDQILDAAMRCFARQGYRATSMEDIVRESGLSVGAIYTYFSSKEELFCALADARMEQNVGYIRELFSRPGPFSEKSAQAVDFFFGLLSEEQLPYLRLTFEVWVEALKSERLAARNKQRCEHARSFFLWMFKEAQQRDELRDDVDVAAAAEVMMALHDGLVMHYVSGNQEASLEALKHAYVKLFNKGFANPATPILSNPPTVAVAHRA